MRLTGHIAAAVFCAAVLAAAPPAFGRVFWRWRADTGNAVFKSTPGWRAVYRTSVRINGGQGQLEVLQCDDAIDDVMARLKTAFPGARPDNAFSSGDSAGQGLVLAGDTVTRMLALDLGTPGQTVLFVLTQSLKEYERSLAPPSTHMASKAFVYPDSRPRLFVADARADARLEIAATPARPPALWDFFDINAAQHGYSRLFPPAGRRPAGGLAIFQKGADICCVLIRPERAEGNSIITVLQKKLNVEKAGRQLQLKDFPAAGFADFSCLLKTLRQDMHMSAKEFEEIDA